VVAIKCVAKRSLNKASVENLLTEIEILKDIRHPHIVQLKDFQVGAWDGTPSKESWRRDTVFRLPLYL
jgi:serine/threonine protein kinase